MSYCVHCGVELDPTASFCPLCHTPVADPRQPVDTDSPKPFPTRRGEVAPVSKVEVGLLITAMLASVAVCCGVLNLFLHAGRAWSLYVIGAAAMLWLWLVPPLLARGMHLLLRLAVGVGAVLLYVYLISVDLDGRTWFLGLAAPLILWGGAVLLEEKACTGEQLYRTALELLADGSRRSAMGKALKELSAPHAAQDIYQALRSVMKQG